MGECVEKIYCCDRSDNDNALAAAIMANSNNRRDDWGPMAAMMNGGMNNWMNNPFAYLMFLALFRNGGFGFGDGNGAGVATQGIETQAQLNAIRTQLQDNQNAGCIKSAIQGNGFALSQLAQTLNIDFNTLQKCCCDVQAAIQQVAGQVGFSAERIINAVNLGDCNVIQAQQDKCDILRAGQDNTQRIIDTLNNHWSDEKSLQIQDLKFQLSQKEQNEKFAAMLYGSRNGNGCGCNNCGGCGCGCGQ